jgi:hypothetical protein
MTISILGDAFPAVVGRKYTIMKVYKYHQVRSSNGDILTLHPEHI